MIKHVSIGNFAILDKVELDFNPSLTVITGETGSGKSILLQAIGVATGGKTTKTMVKSGEKRAVVEVDFDGSSFRRILFNTGSSKSFADDEPIKIADLQALTGKLLDFHGQHEQQLIMDPGNHIEYLDRYGNLLGIRRELESTYNELNAANDELEKRRQLLASSKEKTELLEFQKNEITAVNPRQGEDEDLSNNFQKLSNIDRIQNTVKEIHKYMIDSDGSVSERLGQGIRDLGELCRYAGDLKKVTDQLEDARLNLQDALDTAMGIADSAVIDPEQLREYEERILALEGLKRKYGGSIEAVLDKLQTIESQLAELSSLDENITELRERIRGLEEKYSALALKIHKKRVELTGPLAEQIEKGMEILNMPGGKFEIHVDSKPDPDSFFTLNGKGAKIFPDGIDIVTFFLSANPGEKPKPLAEIASGGEISRIMLAIKSVFSKIDPVHTLIFDEIDSGISGLTAEKVAKSLRVLANGKQVICITHLPQIASQADNHLHVTKKVMGNKTSVSFDYVKGDVRMNIIRQLYSGKDRLESIDSN